MSATDSQFKMPAVVTNSDGEERTVGFELEFSGIKLRDTVKTVCAALDGTVTRESAAEVSVQTDMGDFNVEVDWDFLKRTANRADEAQLPEAWMEQVSEAAALLVPIEVVCPPLPITGQSRLIDLVEALRDAGAVGTEESLIALTAYT